MWRGCCVSISPARCATEPYGPSHLLNDLASSFSSAPLLCDSQLFSKLENKPEEPWKGMGNWSHCSCTAEMNGWESNLCWKWARGSLCCQTNSCTTDFCAVQVWEMVRARGKCSDEGCRMAVCPCFRNPREDLLRELVLDFLILLFLCNQIYWITSVIQKSLNSADFWE